MSEVNLNINGKKVTTPVGATILEAAQTIGEEIPTICYHEACTANGLCRLCVVEVEGARVLAASCVERVREGMEVQTRSDRVERSRRTILEMLDSAVDLSEAPDVQGYMEDYAVDREHFPEAARRNVPIFDDNPMYIRDYAQCVLCWRCVQVCAEDAQYTFALNFKGRGFETQIGTFFDKPMPQTTCVFCGQCVGVCPTGALKPKREWLLEQGKTADEVFQVTRTEKRRKRRDR
jgi:NADH dehydrogenase/NADH:ubiquinone oxidoreductase subunit G